jgi:hypothetical protein
MPDKKTYDILLSKGIRVDNCAFCRYDSLASEDDLSCLFETLTRYQDSHGNHPVLTANSVVANPDFEKIRLSDFREYHYELFTDTLARYPKHSGSFELWKEGMEKNLLHPQFHGREHLHVARWMKALKLGLPETRITFDMNLFGISKTITTEKRRSYLAAFDIDEPDDKGRMKEIVTDGLRLFSTLFGYRSRSFVAPNFLWPTWLEEDLGESGVQYVQTLRKQYSPSADSLKTKTISHYTGQRNGHDQVFTVRNCHFEPALNLVYDTLNNCLSQIQDAFRWRKPAIVSVHRVNFIGSIVPSNRENNMKLFRNLLTEILRRWPDAEFMTTDTLGSLIRNGRKYND